VFESLSGGLILSLVCLFLRGPQPVTCATRAPVFETFFESHFLVTFWSQMVSPREPKIVQNRQKSCSRGLPESTRQKVTKNDAIWEGWICNPHTPVQSKHTFSFSRFGQKSDPKSLPKWSLGAPQITKNQEKWALKKRQFFGAGSLPIPQNRRAQRAQGRRRRPKRRGAPPQAADSRCAKLNAIFGSAVLPLTLKSGTKRLSRNS